MRGLLNKIDDAILIIDLEGKIKFVNLAYLCLTEHKENEVIDKELGPVIYNESGTELSIRHLKECINKDIVLKLASKFRWLINVEAEIFTEYFNGENLIFIKCREVKEEKYSKEDLEKCLDRAPVMISIKDTDGKYLYKNYISRKNLNVSSISDNSLSTSNIYNKLSGLTIEQEDELVIRSKRSKTFQRNLTLSNGITKYIKSYKEPIFDNRGNVKYITVVSKDKTLAKKLDYEFDISYKELTDIDTLLHRDNQRGEKYERLNHIQDYISNTFNTDGVNIWVYDDESEKLVSKFRCGLSNKVQLHSFNDKISKADIVNSFNELKLEGFHKIEDLKSCDNLEGLKDNSIKYTGLFKISYDNEFLGIISILSKEYNEFLFSNEQLIRLTCNRMGMVIKNTNLKIEVKKEFHKRTLIEEELQHFLDTATDMMVILDKNGKFIKVNNGCTSVLSINEEKLLKTSWKSLIHQSDYDETKALISYAMKNPNEIVYICSRFIDFNNKILWIEIGLKYIKDREIFICTANDITHIRKLESERQKFEASMQLEKIRSEFFSNISHEFKTPLNIIFATMQLINKSIDSGDVKSKDTFDLKKYTNAIKQNSYRLLRLVNNLIDITRIDTGYYKLNMENINIISVIEDIAISVAQYVEDKGITLTFDTEIEEQLCACDPDKIERIMLNLLSNATKYTGLDGKIDVNIGVRERNVVVSVKDNGIGIPKDKINGIFDRFVQVDNSLTRKCEGSGIGLALVKSLVEMHGGNIKVYSKDGEGTEFIFNLPIKTIENEIKISENNANSKIEKCVVEFSDIYK